MKDPEKYPESFLQTVNRTIFTTAIITFILYYFDTIPPDGKSKLIAFGIIWTVIFCIVFGGHWLELLFINFIKFGLPKSMLLLYFVRVCYWFLSSILLFLIANTVRNLLENKSGQLGNWWIFGLLYIGIQLVMYAIMQLRLKKSFYNGIY